MFCSPEDDADFFDIITGLFQGDTQAPYLFIICLNYVLQTSIDLMEENGITLKKMRSRRYPAETITYADNTGDQALLKNTSSQTESNSIA